MKNKTLMYFLYLTNRCNLNCKYCFVKKNNQSMSFKFVKKALSFAESLDYNNISLIFFGGEPLLKWDLLKKAIEYSYKNNKISKRIISTNCILLDKNKLNFIKEHNISLGLSIDGIREAQDNGRITNSKKGTFGIIKEKLELLKEYINEIEMQIRMTVIPQNIKYLNDSLCHILNMGHINSRINIIPEVFISSWNKNDFELFDKELIKISITFIEYYNKGTPLNICFNADGDHYQLMRIAQGTKFSCCAGKNMLAILPNGDVYPCYFLAGLKNKIKKKFCLGNISDGKIQLDNAEEYSLLSENKYLSCPTWNYILEGGHSKPSDIYRRLFKSIYNASERIVDHINK